jgi:hypothetical protein
MKIRIRDLKRVIREAMLHEDDSQSHDEDASGDSIDSQVDRYLAEYEGDSKKTDSSVGSTDQMESLDWRDLVKGHLITEAGEGDKDGEDKGDAAPGADGITGDDTSKMGLDTLDVEKFANDVVRLIDNYDSLLEVKNTIVRRATNFLKKTYSEEVVKAFQDTLRDDHSIEAGKDKGELDAEKYSAPAADRANGSAEAGPGGAPGGA